MNILIPHSWLKEFLDTKASVKEIARCLSLCGPSIEKINKVGKDYVYDIEVTSNRVDCMSVYGIAREAAAILPRFNHKAKLKPYQSKRISHNKSLDIEVINDPKLCHRILAVKLENIKLAPSPKWLAERLNKVGQRSLNNAIDITNYIMWELGTGFHVFDYDRIESKKIVVREARKGEKLITLDKKEITLDGGEVVFDNGRGEIIDLPGIMGTANTVVTKNTKNVLLWVENIDPVKIRKASTGLNIRTQAAVLFEKYVDPNLGFDAILKGVEFFQKLTNAQIACNLLDIYPVKSKTKQVCIEKEFIDTRLGVNISKTDIKNYLNPLDLKAKWCGNKLSVKVPTFRAHDINIPEDVVEEIARIYGYFRLPSNLMETALPKKVLSSPFDFEMELKRILSSVGGVEIYTSSLVPNDWINKQALKLANPLGKETEYLRTSLRPSLVKAALGNSSYGEPYHLFEMANVYLPRKDKLPNEKMYLAGIFSEYSYREAKGVIETLLLELNIKVNFLPEDLKGFQASRRVLIKSNNKTLGEFGILEKEGLIYYEFETQLLINNCKEYTSYKPIPKYPPQIEDITLILPEKTKVGSVIHSIKAVDKRVDEIELTDIYINSYTFRINYQDPNKTLTNEEVEKIRNKILGEVKKKYSALPKS